MYFTTYFNFPTAFKHDVLRRLLDAFNTCKSRKKEKYYKYQVCPSTVHCIGMCHWITRAPINIEILYEITDYP